MMRPGGKASWRSLALLGVLALVLALGAGCALRAGLDPRTATFPPPRFHPKLPLQGTVGSGVPWFWFEDHDVPLVRIYLGVRAGEVYDPPERAGLARVASLAWRTGGAGDLSPEAFDDALEGRGMELGVALGRDKGWITLSVLPDDLEQGLDLLASLVFEPALRPDRVEWARSQVSEAIRRQADEPQGLAFREMRRALYGNHPRGLTATEESVGRISRDDLVALHRTLVERGTWVVGAVGDFDPDRLRALLEARFSGLPAGGDAFPPLPPPTEPEPVAVVVPKALPQATVVWARLGPSRTDPAFAPMEVGDYVLGAGGFGSRLVREIRSDRGLAYSVGSFYQALRGFGVLGAYTLTKTGSVAQVIGLLQANVRGLADTLTDGDVARAREALVNRHVFRYADPADLVRERMGLWLSDLPLDLGVRYPAEIEAVSTEAVARVARRYLDPSRGVWVIVGDVDPAAPLWRRLGKVRVVRVR